MVWAMQQIPIGIGAGICLSCNSPCGGAYRSRVYIGLQMGLSFATCCRPATRMLLPAVMMVLAMLLFHL